MSDKPEKTMADALAALKGSGITLGESVPDGFMPMSAPITPVDVEGLKKANAGKAEEAAEAIAELMLKGEKPDSEKIKKLMGQLPRALHHEIYEMARNKVKNG